MIHRQDAKSAKDAKKKEPDRALDQLAYAAISAAIEVHRLLGPVFREAIYEGALCVELQLREIPFVRQPVVTLHYKGHVVGEGRLDVLIGDAVVIELKAVDMLAPIHTAQLLSYLKATGYQLGLLMNFNVPILKDGIKRVILT